jgi:hypothetical protein
MDKITRRGFFGWAAAGLAALAGVGKAKAEPDQPKLTLCYGDKVLAVLGSIPEGEWIHVAAWIKADGTAEVYLDGVPTPPMVRLEQ